MDDFQGEEMPSINAKYTWSYRQEERIYSKIDWVFVNAEWLDNMPYIKCYVL